MKKEVSYYHILMNNCTEDQPFEAVHSLMSLGSVLENDSRVEMTFDREQAELGIV